MSRLAKKPIVIPDKVAVKVDVDGLEVSGPRGSLRCPIPQGISVEVESNKALIKRENDWPSRRARQGLTFSLLKNCIIGVTEGFKKELEIVGIGYKAQIDKNSLILSLGYSHDINYPIPEGIKIETPAPVKIIVTGNDKQKVGQVAAEIRGFRKPEVYKGKGIRYTGEVVRKKVGKAGV